MNFDPARVPQKDFLPRMGSGCLVLLGVFMLIGGVGALADELAGGILLTLVGIGFGVAGVYWFRYITGVEGKRREQFQEKMLLHVAARHQGTVTLALVALETPLSAAEAEETLNRLCHRGFANPDVLDDGTVVYRFGGLLR